MNWLGPRPPLKVRPGLHSNGRFMKPLLLTNASEPRHCADMMKFSDGLNLGLIFPIRLLFKIQNSFLFPNVGSSCAH
jgi:hypothetical protein